MEYTGDNDKLKTIIEWIKKNGIQFVYFNSNQGELFDEMTYRALPTRPIYRNHGIHARIKENFIVSIQTHGVITYGKFAETAIISKDIGLIEEEDRDCNRFNDMNELSAYIERLQKTLG